MLKTNRKGVNNFRSQYELLSIRTEKAFDFVDLTLSVQNLVKLSQIEFGIVNVQTKQTTAGLLLNEKERLTIEDSHAYCNPMDLSSWKTVNIAHRNLDLGKWQRLFLVELDAASVRTLSVMLMGFSFRAEGAQACDCERCSPGLDRILECQ